jgi:hypothetical protein
LWPGTITLPNWLNFEQDAAWRDAIAAVTAQREELTRIDAVTDPKIARLFFPAIGMIVQKWDLGGEFPCPPTVETFPSTPGVASAQLLVTIISAIDALYSDASDLPLALPPPPTDT